MLLIVLSVGLSIIAVAVLVAMTVGKGKSKLVSSRLAALDHDFSLPPEDAATDIRKAQERLSEIAWLNRWLVRMNLAAASGLYLYQAGVTLTLGTLILFSFTGSGVLGYLLYLRCGQIMPALLFSVAVLPLPFWVVQRRRTKRLALLEQQLPDALSTMASALRVGHSLVASLGAAAQESPEPISTEIRKCFEEQNYGVDLRTSLTNLTTRVPVQDYRIFVAAVLIQKESGGNLAEVLEKVLQTARDRFRLKKQVNVHTAQGRMTGWILSLLPLVIGLFMYVMNPDSMSVLWTRPIGLKMLYAASGMDILGALVIRKIVSVRV